MKSAIVKLGRRCAAMCLAAALLCASALAAEAEKSQAEKRREDLEFLYQTVLVEHHPDVFANTPEAEFLALKKDIESRLETESDIEFLLDLMRLTALAGDSHTSINGVGALAEQMRYYPFSLVLRENRWYLTTVPAAEKSSLGRQVAAINGRPVEEVIEAFAPLFSADNPVILARRFRQYCQLADMYAYLGLAEAGEPLTLTLSGGKKLSLDPVSSASLQKAELASLADRITRKPATAQAESNYFARPLNRSTFYIQYNACQEAEDMPMEAFAAVVSGILDEGDFQRVLLDLRNNGGGSDGVVWPLLEVLRSEMADGCELVGLIGPATFSSALINAVEIQEMGGVLVGESTGGSVSHFGSVRGFLLPNSGIRGQLSSKYIDLNTLLDAGAGRGVVALEPDMPVPQTMADTLAGKDTAVEWLLSHPERLSQREYPGAPLTRGRFVGQLYEAAGSPGVTLDGLPFADNLGIEWYIPAMAWARETGISRGGADGSFFAARQLTWQEAAVFLVRAAEAQGLKADPSRRSGPLPAPLAGGWAQDAAVKAWDWGLFPDGADFSKSPTRAQGLEMAENLSRLLK